MTRSAAAVGTAAILVLAGGIARVATHSGPAPAAALAPTQPTALATQPAAPAPAPTTPPAPSATPSVPLVVGPTAPARIDPNVATDLRDREPRLDPARWRLSGAAYTPAADLVRDGYTADVVSDLTSFGFEALQSLDYASTSGTAALHLVAERFTTTDGATRAFTYLHPAGTLVPGGTSTTRVYSGKGTTYFAAAISHRGRYVFSVALFQPSAAPDPAQARAVLEAVRPVFG